LQIFQLLLAHIKGYLSLKVARHPRKGHPIRTLREIIGKAQGEFAKTIGISADYLKVIEGGRQLRPENYLKLARRIQWETGISAQQLVKGRLKSMFRDQQYTLEHYQQWKRRHKGSYRGLINDKPTARHEADNLAPWIEVLFRAAAERNRLGQVSEMLIESLNEYRELFKLGEKIDGILKREAKLPHDDKYGGQPTLLWNPEGRSSEFADLWRRRRRVESATRERQRLS
jgi:DNA-binding XRE family transcriptional regulator